MAKRRVEVTVLLLCLCLSWLPCVARAASTLAAKEPIASDRDCQLTIAYRYDTSSFSGHPVRLYRIADVSTDFACSLTAPFANSGLTLNGIQSVSEWNVIRTTLEAYIFAGNLDADHTGVTDQAGEVCFSALKPGLYLAITEPVIQKDWRYTFDSALVALPGLDAEGLWQYEVTATAKAKATPPAETEEEIPFKVLKLWKGDAGRSDRPKSIEVEIFRNGVSYQTVILSEENHWTYQWKAKDDGASWQVLEKNVPTGYTVTVEKQEAAFVLTNTRTPDPQDIPKTGDTSHIMLHFLLMNVSGIMLILLGIAGKRRHL